MSPGLNEIKSFTNAIETLLGLDRYFHKYMVSFGYSVGFTSNKYTSFSPHYHYMSHMLCAWSEQCLTINYLIYLENDIWTWVGNCKQFPTQVHISCTHSAGVYFLSISWVVKWTDPYNNTDIIFFVTWHNGHMHDDQKESLDKLNLCCFFPCYLWVVTSQSIVQKCMKPTYHCIGLWKLYLNHHAYHISILFILIFTALHTEIWYEW